MDIMIMPGSHGKSLLTTLVRGTLGGMAGGFALAAVEACLISPTDWNNWLVYFFICAIYGLPFGGFLGSVLSIGIWLIHAQTGKALGVLTRGTFGTVFGMIACAIVLYANTSDQKGYIHRSWTANLVGIFLLGLAFGGIPALLVGNQRNEVGG
jgi:hypothetical protein